MAQSLQSLLADAPLTVCLGPGGVGKTTISAVLALHAAAAQQRSLVLTIDPARRLADALNLPSLTNDPTQVRSFSKMHPGGELSALMLDPTATFDHLIALLVIDPQRRQALLQNRFYQHMSRSLAGTLEYMAVERLHDLINGGQFDRIVLDTPPTTNALDFLQAPDRLASFFSERVTRWFVRKPKKRQWSGQMFDRAGAGVLSLLGKIAGNEFVDETVGFFSAFGDILGDFRLRGERIGDVLRRPDTRFIVVTGAKPARMAEALEIDRHLRELGQPASAFIINRVAQPFVPRGVDAQAALRRATELLGGQDEQERATAFIGRLQDLYQQCDALAQQQAESVADFRAQVLGRPVFTAPQVPQGQSARAALLAIYVGLFSSTDQQ